MLEHFKLQIIEQAFIFLQNQMSKGVTGGLFQQNTITIRYHLWRAYLHYAKFIQKRLGWDCDSLEYMRALQNTITSSRRINLQWKRQILYAHNYYLRMHQQVSEVQIVLFPTLAKLYLHSILL